MITLFNFIKDSYITETFEYIDACIINEALNSSILRDVATQLRKIVSKEKEQKKDEFDDWERRYGYRPSLSNSSFSKIFGDNYIEWDKITDDDIEIYDSKEIGNPKLASEVRKVLQGKSQSYIFIKNPETNEFQYAITYNKVLINLASGYRRTGDRMYKKTQKDIINLCADKIAYIIQVNKFSTTSKILKRRNDKDGTIMFDEWSLKKIAEKNISRYKEIIAKNKVARDNNDKLIDEVEEVLKKTSEIAATVAKNPIQYSDIISNLNSLVQCCYDKRRYVPGQGKNRYTGTYTGMNGLLPTLYQYIDLKRDIQKTGGYEYQRNSLETAKNELKKTLAIAQTVLTKIESQL